MSEIAQAPHSSPDGKIPQLRFPEFNDNWEEQKVGSFMVERNKKSPKSEAFPLMSFVARKGVTEKGKRYNREFLVNDEGGKKYKQTEYGDFIYSSNNLETGSIGLNKYGAATISPVYSIFQITDTCNYEFVSSSLVTKIFIHKMVRFRQGVVYGQWRIHESDFLKIQVELPSLEEQTKIASFLSSIDSKIEQLSKKQALLGEYKKGLMQQIFSQAIRFQADDGCDFPDWKERRLEEVANFQRGKNILEDKLGDKLLLGMGSVTEKGNLLINKNTSEQYITLLKNDLVMPERDIGRGLIIGRVALIGQSDKYVLGANILSLTINSDNSSRFLFQIINENNFRKKVRKIVSGSAQLMITSKDAKKLALRLPVIEEQQQIANFLSSIDNKIEQVGKQLDESKQFKKALLQQMFV